MDVGLGPAATDVVIVAPTAWLWALVWTTCAACGLALVPAMPRVWLSVDASTRVPSGVARATAVGSRSRDGVAVSASPACEWHPGWRRRVSRPGWSSGMRQLMRSVGTMHRSLYRWTGGRIGKSLCGRPVLLLTTIGRKTGRKRTWPLCYIVAGDEVILVASAGGDSRHPAWYLNLRANPCVDIQQGDGIRTMIARTADGIEHAQLWERLVHQFPVAARYQRKTSRMIPVVILRPATP